MTAPARIAALEAENARLREVIDHLDVVADKRGRV